MGFKRGKVMDYVLENVNTYNAVPIFAAIGLIAYAAMSFMKNSILANQIAIGVLIIGTIPILGRMLKKIFSGQFGVDIIAIFAIAFSLILGQNFAGLIILLMLSGGEALEYYALRRARSDLTKLLESVPKIAHIKKGEKIFDIPLNKIRVGDILVVKAGEIIPADGVVVRGSSFVNESMITGESMPVEKNISNQVYSGTVNSSNVLEIRAIRSSRESEYERIVALVREAQESRAPIVRLADRYSIGFIALTAIMAVGAWMITKNPITALAVLVVATPCPLILATPIAIVSGMGRAAKNGIIIKSGGALEKLGTIKTFVFDKTGTITLGTPTVRSIRIFSGSKIEKKEFVKIAASLDQLSAHPLAKSLVQYALGNGINLEYPSEYHEKFGEGVFGQIGKDNYLLGSFSFISRKGARISNEIEKMHESLLTRGETAIYLARGKNKPKIIGAVYFEDAIKPETKKVFKLLEENGVDRTILLTGDRKNVAEMVARETGIEEVFFEATPGEKVRKIKSLQRENPPVAMVGDGINDAPALAQSDVGITMGAMTASAEAGDIVIPQNNLTKVGEAFSLSQRVVGVAKGGIFIGMSGSLAMMVAASFGYLSPVTGAILQEGLDVIVIMNALRIIFDRK